MAGFPILNPEIKCFQYFILNNIMKRFFMRGKKRPEKQMQLSVIKKDGKGKKGFLPGCGVQPKEHLDVFFMYQERVPHRFPAASASLSLTGLTPFEKGTSIGEFFKLTVKGRKRVLSFHAFTAEC